MFVTKTLLRSNTLHLNRKLINHATGKQLHRKSTLRVNYSFCSTHPRVSLTLAKTPLRANLALGKSPLRVNPTSSDGWI